MANAMMKSSNSADAEINQKENRAFTQIVKGISISQSRTVVVPSGEHVIYYYNSGNDSFTVSLVDTDIVVDVSPGDFGHALFSVVSGGTIALKITGSSQNCSGCANIAVIN